MKLKKVMAILSVATMLAGGFASFAELIQPNITVKAATHNRKHKKSSWKRGVPKALRGDYYAKTYMTKKVGEWQTALKIGSNQFVEWSRFMPVTYNYYLRYKKIGHNKYTILYNTHITPPGVLGGKNIKRTITKIDKNHFKVKGFHQIFRKVKKSNPYIKNMDSFRRYVKIYGGYHKYHKYVKKYERENANFLY